MTAQIAIIGLGQIGASVGLALKERQSPLLRVGYDKDPAVANASRSLGVVDQVRDPVDATREADIVLLSLPLGELPGTVKRIAGSLKESAVILDTAPIKRSTMQLMHELIPAGRYYVGLVPAITTEAFTDPEIGLKAARPDLFKRTVMIIDAPPETPMEVEQLAVNFARLLGAKPLLTGADESDAIMAGIHLLPQLLAAGLLDSTVDQPGWSDRRKLAGRPFVSVTGGMAYYDDPESLTAASLANPQAMLSALDVVMASLKGLRDDIAQGDEESVRERLQHAFDAREAWLTERGAADWLSEGGEPAEIPNTGEQIMQMLFGSRIIDRNKKRK